MTSAASSSVPSAAEVILSAQGLSKSFRMGDSQISVLKHVDLAVRRGEFLAIEGRSGSGKSTLLHLLGALDTADAGQVVYDGKPIAALSGTARSRLRNVHFGFVFQFYHLLPEMNVLENAMLGSMIEHSFWQYLKAYPELRRHAEVVLEQMGLSHRLKHRPNQLSGGERQRVAIARALMNSPQVLFADEPTGNLDAETGRQIMAVLEKLHRDRKQTIIMVTHDRTLARQADRVLVLREGRLDRTTEPGS